MSSRLFPRSFDNAYRGHALAPWLFALLVLVKSAIGLNSVLFGRLVASRADGIPLDAFAPAAARAVVAMFAAWGLAQLAIGALCVLALVRYRAMIPLLFALLLVEHVGRRLVFLVMPVADTRTPPGLFVNLVLLALLAVGLALSLWRPRGPRGASSPAA